MKKQAVLCAQNAILIHLKWAIAAGVTHIGSELTAGMQDRYAGYGPRLETANFWCIIWVTCLC